MYVHTIYKLYTYIVKLTFHVVDYFLLHSPESIDFVFKYLYSFSLAISVRNLFYICNAFHLCTISICEIMNLK